MKDHRKQIRALLGVVGALALAGCASTGGASTTTTLFSSPGGLSPLHTSQTSAPPHSPAKPAPKQTETTLAPSPPTTPAPSPPPATTTTQTTTDSIPAPAAVTRHLSEFQSPSGNIGCEIATIATIGGDAARCDIDHRGWQPPPQPSSCKLDFGQGLQVTDSGTGGFVCAGDTALDPNEPVLPYGQDTRFGPFRCASRTDGVTCVQTNTGHGFFIAYGSYRVF